MHGKEASDASLADSIGLLFDGDSETTVYGEDSAYENVNVKIHMDKVMEVDSVNVYANNSSFTAISGFDVYASMDGINYDFVAALENDPEITTDEIDKFALAMPGTVYAQDLKVVVKAADGMELEIAEIEAYGKPAEASRVRMTNYSYDDEVPFVTADDILAQDADCTALSDGLSAQVSTTGDYLSVIYDLGSFHQVEDITVKGNHGGFELLTSPDGYSYFSSAYYPASTTESVAWGRAENNAKYVKLVFHKPDGSNIILSEIELYARKLKNTKKDASVPVRVTMKPNNIIYVDWSDYNANEDEQGTYNLYIEEEYFTSTEGLTPKKVFVDQSTTQVSDIEANFATYAGLNQNSTYYVAVAEAGATAAVSPVKITTNSAVGGDSAAGIFCINEYDGGSYIMGREAIKTRLYTNSSFEKIKLWEADEITEAEIEALPDDSGATAKVRKLVGDIESVQKNRNFNVSDGYITPYLTRGVSFLPESIPTTQENADRYEGWGIYTFGHVNEPEIGGKYGNGKPGTDDAALADQTNFATTFAPVMESAYDTLKSVSPTGSLYSPTLCGTDMYRYLEALYRENDDIGDHYDVLDVHMYSKTGDSSQEQITGAENRSVPEKLINKADLLNGILADYGDKKELVSTEVGWSTSTDLHVFDYTDEAKQAEFIARMYLSGIMADIKEVYLYAFQDEGYLSNEEVAAGETYITRVNKGSDNAYNDLKTGTETTYYIARSTPNREHMYGVVDWYGDPKPGYYSFYTLGKVLRDAYFVERIDGIGDLNYGAVFYDELKDKYVTALWEISGSGSMVHVDSDEDSLLQLDMYGGVTQVSPGMMSLTTAPIYLYSDEPLSVSLKSRNLISGNGYGSADSNVASTYARLGYNVTVANNDAAISATNMPSGADADTYFSQGLFGQLATNATTACIWSNWGSKTTEITVDLGKSYKVDGVDAAAFAESANQTFTKIKVEVSTDGTNYDVVVPETTLVDGTNSFITAGTTSGQYERLSINNFTAVSARYVKVTMTGGVYQIVPNEVLVFGK